MTPNSFPQAFALEGQTALVTGGGTGLGLAIAKCLTAAGARVAIAGRREDVLRRAAEEIGPATVALPCDLTDLDALPQFVKRLEQETGPLTILVNNAGISMKKPSFETSDEDFAEVMRIHVAAANALARETARRMLPRGKGRIVFIGSMASLLGVPEVSAYSAAKTAVIGLTRTLAAEWSSEGVRVNAICPGWIDAGMAAKTFKRDQGFRDKVLSRTPMRRLGAPEDIGWATVYLCSEAARFVTGCVLVVDGGASIGF